MTWFLLDHINPEPWEAPEGSIVRPKGKKWYVQFHKTARSRTYQEAIADEFRKRYPEVEPVTVPCAISFYFWRTLDASRARHVDATNLQKATEDALQGLLYQNDVLVVHVQSWIMEQGPDVDSRILVQLDFLTEPPAWVNSIAGQLRATKPKTDPNLRDITPDDYF